MHAISLCSCWPWCPGLAADRPAGTGPAGDARHVMGCYVAIGSALFNFLRSGSSTSATRWNSSNDFATMLATSPWPGS